jgi:hypothetical protein
MSRMERELDIEATKQAETENGHAPDAVFNAGGGGQKKANTPDTRIHIYSVDRGTLTSYDFSSKLP